jgi:hypothetical protein
VSATTLAGHEWWLASRAAGVVALVLVSSSVGLGLATAARLFPPSMRRAVLTVHQQTALAVLASIVAHGVLLLPDHWPHPEAVGFAVPFRDRLPARGHRARHPRRLSHGSPRTLLLCAPAHQAAPVAATAHGHARGLLHGLGPCADRGHGRRGDVDARPCSRSHARRSPACWPSE